MEARKTRFSFDGSDKVFDGYTLDQTWNGWACPLFELNVAMDAMKYFNENSDESVIIYDKDKSEFLEQIYGETYPMSEQTEIETEDGMKKLHPLGANCWTWIEE